MSSRSRLTEKSLAVVSPLRTAWRSSLTFDLSCKVVSAAIVTPLSAWFLRAILQWSGESVVSNSDLIAFFFSVQGMFLIVAWATAAFGVLFFELGGLALIAIGTRRGFDVSAWQVFRHLLDRFPALLLLALRQFVVLAAVGMAWLAVVAVTKTALLGNGDFYFYLKVRPPVFWWALAVSSVAALAAAALAVVLLLRWIFAVPLLLVGTRGARDAMQASYRQARQLGMLRIGCHLVVWGLAMLVLTVAAGACHELLRWILMSFAGERVRLVLAFAGLLLAVDFLLVLCLGIAAATSLAMVISHLFEEVTSELPLPDCLVSHDEVARRRQALPTAGIVLSALALLVGLSCVLTYSLIERIHLDTQVAVTAHRGSSRRAPENSMASILQAIEDGADFAEIDVQETADGVPVLLHDNDLRRVAGVDKAIWEVRYDEINQLDLGSWFSDAFVGERIVTLEEAIEAARGRIKLNIELKFHGHNQQLVTEVIRLVKQAGFEDECIVTSLDYNRIRELERAEVDVRRGLIVTAAIGDPTQADVDLLAVNAQQVNRDLIDRAHELGKEVHVWTVNDPSQMLTMIHLGVDNILTSTPYVLVDLIREREQMSDAEKLMLFVADFLGGRL